MNILNSITYTQANREDTIQVNRSARLTIAGAQRILRKMGYTNAIVSRVDTLIDKR